jgi:hypothetical protein
MTVVDVSVEVVEEEVVVDVSVEVVEEEVVVDVHGSTCQHGKVAVVAVAADAARTAAAHSCAFDAFGHCALHASFTGLHFLQEPPPVSLKKHFMFSRHQRHE